MMKIWLASAISIAPLAFAAAPAQAQDRVTTIFGNDKCPANTICVVAKENERYRIPKAFRSSAVNPSPDSQSWAARSQGTISTGRTGPSACVGASNQGGTGCFIQEMRRAKQDQKAREAAADDVP